MSFENKTFDEIAVGDEASLERLCRVEDLLVFAHASGNHNPVHLPDFDGDGDGRNESVAPAMWVGSLVSAVLGNVLPGPGCQYRAQSFRFGGRAQAGDTLRVTVKVIEKRDADRIVVFDTRVTHLDGSAIADGVAEIRPSRRKLSFDALDVPGLVVERHAHFDAMLARAHHLRPTPTAVVAPESPDALEGALLAARHHLIAPLLIGDEALIRRLAGELDETLDGAEIVHEPDHDRAAARGVALIHEGRAEALMKGHIHTDELLRHVIKRDGGLRGRRRLSHVFVMDVPGLPHLLLITDAAINIAPDLETKVDIVQNAIDLARALGIQTPRCGVLSAVETVNLKMQSSVDAAILSKMAERGQITGGLVDGPLAMDNAINMAAARVKGLHSEVAGRAEILVAPNIESGNMMAKELTFLAHAGAGGIVLGAKCPVILTSRADDEKARLASCAVASLYADWLRRGGAKR